VREARIKPVEHMIDSSRLPEIDLSSALNLPPGSAVIELMPQSVERSNGATVLGATL
jgi:hypothetical protein